MENIEKALQALRDAKTARDSAQTNFCAKCNELVKSAREFMKETGKTRIDIGDRRQGVEIPNEGRVNWNGITTFSILEGYEKELLTMIQKETSLIVGEISKLTDNS